MSPSGILAVLIWWMPDSFQNITLSNIQIPHYPIKLQTSTQHVLKDESTEITWDKLLRQLILCVFYSISRPMRTWIT